MESLSSDFRDLLVLNRRRYRSPIIPAKIWQDLGRTFDMDQWNTVLHPYRSTIVGVEWHEDTTTHAEFDSERSWSNVILYHDGRGINALKFSLIQTLMHETIHASQLHIHDDNYYRIVNPTLCEDKNYLRHVGEIQAFAHCAALEALFPQYSQNTAERYRDQPQQVKSKFVKQAFRWIERHSALNKKLDICRWNLDLKRKLQKELGSI